jgi:hypothetical protein
MAKQGRTDRNALLREQQVRRGQLSTAGCQGTRSMWDNTQGTLARHLHSVGENDVHQDNRRQLRHLIVALYVCVAATPNLAPF